MPTEIGTRTSGDLVDPNTREAEAASPAGTEDPRPIQRGLTLYLRLRNPLHMPVLLAAIAERQPAIAGALQRLNYVHFARFVPVPDNSALFVITVYDHDLATYAEDFARELDEPFSAILSFVQDAPPLPVGQHMDRFVEFVQRHDMPIPVFSAYPDMTVLEILDARSKLPHSL
jgi:hypothetical protein